MTRPGSPPAPQWRADGRHSRTTLLAPPPPRPRRGPVRSTLLGPTAPLPNRPGAHRLTGRLLAVLFWSGVCATGWIWWSGTPTGSVDGVPAGMVEAGRITGLLGGYLLLVQVLLMSRVGWLDRRVSANGLLGLHRDLGGLLVVLVLAHIALTIVGYAWLKRSPVVAETWSMLTMYDDMAGAFAATVLLVGIGLLAIRAVRAVLPYELWYFVHLSSYAVLLLGYGHQFTDGRDLAVPSAGRALWIGFYTFVVGCFVWGRVLGPLRLNLRHRLRVAAVVHEGGDMFSVYVRGHRLEEMQARAGQFFRWRFLTRGCWWQAHPFSLSAAPNGRWLRLTIKVVGDHTDLLTWLDPGVRVFVEGPSGVFTAESRTRHRALLIAGGSGIAPIRALLEDLPPGVIVIYRASTPKELIFRDELDWFAETRDCEIYYVVGARDDPGPAAVLSPRGLRHLVPDIAYRDVYLCGPEGLVSAAVRVLTRLRVPSRQIHLDPFEF